VTSASDCTWDVLPGLPGDGPAPVSYQSDNPAVWQEPFPVRFRNAAGLTWDGDFQQGYGRGYEVFYWAEAACFFVNAWGFLYFVSAGDPQDFRFTIRNVQCGVAFDDDRGRVFVADYFRIYAFDRNREKVWESDPIAEGVEAIEGYDAGDVLVRAKQADGSVSTVRVRVAG
jgi:hypothetical protein